jgi:glycosyltransferase involved in cell wall biosynthesis
MIRILFIVEDFNIGGLERTVEAIYRGLDARRFSIHLWCLARGGQLAEKFVSEKKPIKILHVKTYHNPLNVIRIARSMRRENFHIVHCHGYFACTMGRLAALMAKPPVVLSHVHTVYWNLSRRNLLVERLLAVSTDSVICCSDAAKDYLMSNAGIDKRKMVTIYNGTWCGNGKFQKKSIEEEGKIVLVIVASLVENKGHKYLLQALTDLVKAYPNILLRIIGDGPIKKYLVHYADSNRISSHVQFLGLIDDINRFVSDADMVILPTVEREGLGLSLIEGMCHGKPLIGTRVGGVPEVIEDGINGFLVPPRDSKALAEKLKILIDDKALRQKMGENSRMIFEKKFTQGLMISKIQSLYTDLLRRKGYDC